MSAPSPIRVVVADDHTLFRQGVIEMLSTAPGIEVIGDGASGTEAIALATSLRPDVVIVDVEMPGPGAKAVIRKVLSVCPSAQVIVLTMHDDPAMVQELLDSGAAAYLVKTIMREEMVAAVRAVGSGRNTVMLSVSRQTIKHLDRQRTSESPLSAREIDVLSLAALAFSNAQIASRLFITEGTVKRHMTNIYAKLGAVSRIDAIRKATAAKLIPAIGESR